MTYPMSMPSDSSRLFPAWAWATACAAIGLASAAAWVLDLSGPLAWHSDNWTRQPWVLWTASLAHLSGPHLLGNLAALGVLAVLGTYLQAGQAAVSAWLVSWPLSTVALLCWPQVTGYSGLSGLLCSALGGLWSHAVWHRDTRAVSWVLLLAMGVKLLSERAWTDPIGYDPNWGFNVVYAAHLAGFVSGAACGWVAAWRVALRDALIDTA